jgi:UDP-N-acetyl-D-glucosamine dehydrogenase
MLDTRYFYPQLTGISKAACACPQSAGNLPLTVLSSSSETLLSKIADRNAHAGVIGLGYVGLPLAITVARSGFVVTGFDIDPEKIVAIDAGRSYIEAVPDAVLERETANGRFQATTDFGRLADCDIVVICVPTPLTKYRDPDLYFLTKNFLSIV